MDFENFNLESKETDVRDNFAPGSDELSDSDSLRLRERILEALDPEDLPI